MSYMGHDSYDIMHQTQCQPHNREYAKGWKNMRMQACEHQGKLTTNLCSNPTRTHLKLNLRQSLWNHPEWHLHCWFKAAARPFPASMQHARKHNLCRQGCKHLVPGLQPPCMQSVFGKRVALQVKAGSKAPGTMPLLRPLLVW